MFDFSVFLSAFGLAASQIVGIGPQNAFVLKQGIGRSHVLPIVAICILCDVLLMACGVLGVGRLLNAIPGFISTVTWLGAAFMLFLAWKAFRAAWSHGVLRNDGDVERDRQRAVRTILLVTLLNPYVWLDTVVLIGGISAAYGHDARWSFLAGSLAASLAWFGAIGFFAGKLAPLFERERAWQVLDVLIGLVMLATAVSLVLRFGGLGL